MIEIASIQSVSKRGCNVGDFSGLFCFVVVVVAALSVTAVVVVLVVRFFGGDYFTSWC